MKEVVIAITPSFKFIRTVSKKVMLFGMGFKLIPSKVDIIIFYNISRYFDIVFHDLFDIVHFNFFQISERGLKSIAKNCKQLRRLSVSRCYGVTDKAVTALVQGCPLLTELDVGWCYKVTDHSLRLIPVHCSHFESIRIKGCNVSDHTLRALYAAGISVNNFF